MNPQKILMIPVNFFLTHSVTCLLLPVQDIRDRCNSNSVGSRYFTGCIYLEVALISLLILVVEEHCVDNSNHLAYKWVHMVLDDV